MIVWTEGWTDKRTNRQTDKKTDRVTLFTKKQCHSKTLFLTTFMAYYDIVSTVLS